MIEQLEFLPPDSPVPPGDTPHWFTPLPWFLDLEHRLLRAGLIPRPFDCDPCGHPEAPVSRLILARGGVIWTAKDDGLSRDWTGRVPFSNPPYDAATLEVWAPEYVRRAPSCPGLTVHVPAWPDRAWWQDNFEQPRRRHELVDWFERGRIYYGWPGNPVGLGGDDAKFPSAVLVWPP